MTDYRTEACTRIQECLERNDAIQARYRHLPEDCEMARMIRAERLQIIDRLISVASTVPPDLPGIHPPVPEQASPLSALEDWIGDNADLWAGWQPGAWPAHDHLDPRGFRWELPPAEE